LVGRKARIVGAVTRSSLTIAYSIQDANGNYAESEQFQLTLNQRPNWNGWCLV
jgi:hypothetical protein